MSRRDFNWARRAWQWDLIEKLLNACLDEPEPSKKLRTTVNDVLFALNHNARGACATDILSMNGGSTPLEISEPSQSLPPGAAVPEFSSLVVPENASTATVASGVAGGSGGESGRVEV